MISLIANTGIQFYEFTLEFNPNDAPKAMSFYEFTNIDTGEVTLEFAEKVGDDIYTPKRSLDLEGYINADGKVKYDEINHNIIERLKELDIKNNPEQRDGYFKYNDLEECFDYFKNNWIPFPYFKLNKENKSQFGPYAWARIFIKEILSEDKTEQKKYKITIIFDTSILEGDVNYYTPKTTDTEETDNIFAPCNNNDYLLNFCDENYNCGWVKSYLKKLQEVSKEGKKKAELYYIARYIFLINYLCNTEGNLQLNKLEKEEKLRQNPNDKKTLDEIKQIETSLQNGVFPKVSLFSNFSTPVDVDLVLDIGNANTCGLLFESPVENKSFNFSSVKKLEITDLSTNIGKKYTDDISMRLVFAEAKFGEISIPEYTGCFIWPSLVRVGNEALQLINKHNIDRDLGVETSNTNSSPKRYLWDTSKSKTPWEFVNIPSINPIQLDLDLDTIPQNKKKVSKQASIEGITEQFTGDGKYCFDADFSIVPHYSKRSLMTFVYIELFLQALTQINSLSFRSAHGKPNLPRRLKRVTITCPTSIVQKEQVELRESAYEASCALKRYYESTYNEKIDVSDFTVDIAIVPSPRSLSKSILETKAGERDDWGYDEATCAQLVFLYAELSKRYLNNCSAFFDLYGKKRNDVGNEYQNSLTIGSIDIGGGTTDLMISAYEYSSGQQSNAVIKPHPLFWESFTLAGDDLLKEIVKEIVIEGGGANVDDSFCNGVLKGYAESKGCSDIAEKLQNFFGFDNAKQTALQRIYRKNFNIQCAIPIALRHLQHAAGTSEDTKIAFDEMFADIKPNPDIIDYLNRFMGSGFDFKEINWQLSRAKVLEIIEKTFDSLIRKLSAVLAAFNCDFVLLSGKLTSISLFREMFIKYYSVSPDKIISLNNYRVGRWYPNFEDKPSVGDSGYFEDTKSIVSVGAIIALMGGKLNKLDGFSLDMDSLTKNVYPTTDFIGALNKQTKDIISLFVTPEENRSTIKVDGLPILIGYKHLPNKSYPVRPIYKLDFNDEYLRQRVLNFDIGLQEESEILEAIESEKNKIRKKFPLKLKIKRDIRENKESFEILSIMDVDRDEKSEKLLNVNLMTLLEEEHYWADTGEFVLNI